MPNKTRFNPYAPIIPKNELVDGAYYHGNCRNAEYARWDAKTQTFYHWRYKYGFRFVEGIHAPEDDRLFDVFVADRLVTYDGEPIPLPSRATDTETTPKQ